MLRGPQFFNILTSKCAVPFFDIWTYKSAPNTSCFVHFHFRMCFSPQRRAIFQHLNFKKCSRTLSFLTCSLLNVLFATAYNFSTSELQKVLPDPQFLTFSLPNVLFATAANNFSTSELQKVLPDCQFFNIFTSQCAFRHSGVQFFDIWTSKSAPSTSCFVHFHVQMCFSPQRRAIFDFSSEQLPPHPPL